MAAGLLPAYLRVTHWLGQRVALGQPRSLGSGCSGQRGKWGEAAVGCGRVAGPRGLWVAFGGLGQDPGSQASAAAAARAGVPFWMGRVA